MERIKLRIPRPYGVEVKKATKVEYPAEGGVLTYFEGEKYPTKGTFKKKLTLIGGVEAIATSKKLILCSTKFLTSKPLIYFVPLVVLLPRKVRNKIIWSALNEFSIISYDILSFHYLKSQFYCDSGREIYRVGNLLVEGFKGIERNIEHELTKRERIIHIIVKTICMIWEFDDYWRFALQDGFGELNIQALRKNPAKEIIRVLEIIRGRDLMTSQSKKWEVIKKAVWLGSKIFRKEFKEFVDLLCLLDWNKMKLDEADSYHALIRENYNFGGISFEERMKRRKKIDNN